MEIKTFIENFADQLDDTPITDLTPETEFKNLEEWSSLTALSIIAMVDEEYDIVLKATDIHQAETIEDLFNIVANKVR